MDLEEIGWDEMDRVGLAQDRDQRSVLVKKKRLMNFRVPLSSGKFFSRRTADGFFRRDELHVVSEFVI
jgi:hypothetical protein